MFPVETLKDWVAGLGPGALARVAAYLLAPGIVVGLSGTGVYAPGSGLDFGRPMAISELKTVVSSQGVLLPSSGLTVLIEPMDGEYQIPFSSPSSMWVSLDPAVVRANADRLRLTDLGFSAKSPLVGVSETIAVVVAGQAGQDVLVPGGRQPASDWRLSSRRSLSVLSSALLACVFGFGMAVARGLSSKAAERTTRKKSTQPGEDQVVHGNAIEHEAGVDRVSPRPKSDGEEVPRVQEPSDE